MNITANNDDDDDATTTRTTIFEVVFSPYENERPNGSPRGAREERIRTGEGIEGEICSKYYSLYAKMMFGGYRQTLSSTRTRLSQTGASYYLTFAGIRREGNEEIK